MDSSGKGKIEKPMTGAEKMEEEKKTKSTVVVLRNMVGHGEVDKQLEEEIIDECSSFGQVVACLIIEVSPDDLKTIDPADHVQIYIQFSHSGETQKGFFKNLKTYFFFFFIFFIFFIFYFFHFLLFYFFLFF